MVSSGCGHPSDDPHDMVEITIQLSDVLARALGSTPEERSRRVIEDAAIEEYRSGRISLRQVGEMLGLDYWQTEGFLTDRRISLNYSIGDLNADQATLSEVLNPP
jgi:predicted HTH domain antitoxin